MDRDDQVDEIVAEWLLARDEGVAADPAEVIRRHPDLAEDLREAFRALGRLDDALAVPGGEAGGTRLGDFRIHREIGRGGMGIVYEAEQVSMGRTVALKVLYPSVTPNAKAVERFRREAQATGRLHHTNIVQIHGMGSERGQWYYAMERVAGRSLSEVLADMRSLRGRPPGPGETPSSVASAISTASGRREEYARVAGMFAGLAEALATAHEAGVVHRDVKPSNLMLDETGTLKILDFGLAAFRNEPGDLTRTGDVLGTPAYMSPEQARAGEVDGRTDVWSLGATLYEVLTLRPPFEGPDPVATLRQVTGRDPPAPRRLEPRIPRDLETVVLKALEKDPARRYATAAALARDLRAVADGAAIAASRIGPLGRAWRRARRHPARAALAAGLALAMLAAGAFAWVARSAEDARRAEAARRRDAEYEALVRTAVEDYSVDLTGGTPPSPEGLRLLTQAIDLVPRRPEAWYVRAVSFPGKPADPLRDLDAARERGLPPTRYHLARAMLLLTMRRVEEASAEATLAGAPDPADAEAQTLRAYFAVWHGNLAEAERILGAVIERPGQDASARLRALYLRALLKKKRLDFSGALADYLALRQARQVGTFSVRLDALIAWTWARLGNAAEAERQIDATLAALDRAPDRIGYDLLHGFLTLYEEGGWAKRVLEAWRRHFPDDANLRNLELQAASPQEALPEVERYLAAHPDQNNWVSTKASHLLALGRVDEALCLSDGLKASCDCEAPWTWSGHALRALGRRDEARRNYLEALRQQPYAMEATYGLAALALDEGRREEALAVLEDAIQRDASRALLHRLRSSVLLGLGRKAEALEAARTALQLAPLSTDGTALQVLTLAAPREALGPLQRVLEVRPADPTARVCLAMAQRALGRPQEALAALDGEPALPRTTNVLYQRMWTVYALDRRGDAALAAAEALEASGRDWRGSLEAAYVRGVSLVTLERWRESLEPLQRFLDEARAGAPPREDPDAAWTFGPLTLSPSLVTNAYSRLAMARLRLGDPEGAIQACEAGFDAVDPEVTNETRAYLHYVRGQARATIGAWEECLQDFDAAVALADDDAAYWYQRGWYRYAVGHVAEAVGDFEKSLALHRDPASAEFAHWEAALALALWQAGRPEDAISRMRSAIRRQPAAPDPRTMLGKWLVARGRTEEALAVPDDPPMPVAIDATLVRMNVLFDLDRFEESLAAAEAVLRERPGDGGAHLLRGGCLWNLLRHEDAVAAWRAGIAALVPVDPEAIPIMMPVTPGRLRGRLAGGLLFLGRLAEATDVVGEGVAAGDGHGVDVVAAAWRSLGRRPFLTDEPTVARAAAVFSAATQVRPPLPTPEPPGGLPGLLKWLGGPVSVHESLARALLWLDRLPEAIAAADEALRRAPPTAGGLALASLARSLGAAPSAEDLRVAGEAADRALALEPGADLARLARAAAWVASGETADAVRILRRMPERSDLAPELPALVLARAWIRAGRPDDARSALAAASERNAPPLPLLTRLRREAEAAIEPLPLPR